MAFDYQEAIKHLNENRNKYIDRLMKYMKHSIERDNYDMAANYIMAASENLKNLDGALSYLEALGCTPNGTYPEFGPIFDSCD